MAPRKSAVAGATDWGILRTESGGTREGFALASTTGIQSATADLQQRTIKRAVVGLLFLIVMVTLGAWLMWASIDPDEASASWTSQAVEANAAQR
jgi:hypothetical protein